MNRSRSFYREMRAKHIRRKKSIAQHCWRNWELPFDGMYSKEKIHCSCPMCSTKTRNKKYKRRHLHGNYYPSINWKHSDKVKIEGMNQDLKEFIDFL